MCTALKIFFSLQASTPILVWTWDFIGDWLKFKTDQNFKARVTVKRKKKKKKNVAPMSDKISDIIQNPHLNK